MSLAEPDDVPRRVKLAAVVSWSSAGSEIAIVSPATTVTVAESVFDKYGDSALLRLSLFTSSRAPIQKWTLPVLATADNGTVSSTRHAPPLESYSLISAEPATAPL